MVVSISVSPQARQFLRDARITFYFAREKVVVSFTMLILIHTLALKEK